MGNVISPGCCCSGSSNAGCGGCPNIPKVLHASFTMKRCCSALGGGISDTVAMNFPLFYQGCTGQPFGTGDCSLGPQLCQQVAWQGKGPYPEDLICGITAPQQFPAGNLTLYLLCFCQVIGTTAFRAQLGCSPGGDLEHPSSVSCDPFQLIFATPLIQAWVCGIPGIDYVCDLSNIIITG